MYGGSSLLLVLSRWWTGTPGNDACVEGKGGGGNNGIIILHNAYQESVDGYHTAKSMVHVYMNHIVFDYLHLFPN